jgi:invasion protein IalB
MIRTAIRAPFLLQFESSACLGTLSRSLAETLAQRLGLALFAADRVQNKSAKCGPEPGLASRRVSSVAAENYRGISMKFRLSTALICALAIAVGSAGVIGSTATAFAQEKKKDSKKKEEAPKANAQPKQQQVAATRWTKLCQPADANTKETCGITQQLFAETGQVLAVVTVIEEKGAQRLFRIAVPFGMLLQPGLRVVIDQNQPIEVKYTICGQGGCLADMEANDAFINGMKGGKTLLVQMINHMGRTVNITFPLNDFGKSYDGPPVDPKEIQAQKKALDNAVQNEAKETLKRIQEQNKKQ